MRVKLGLKEFGLVTFQYSSIWGGLIPMHLLAGYAVYLALFVGWNHVNWLYLAAGYFCIMILGITAGYHRLISHKSYETYRPVRYLLLLFGMMAGQGSPIFWTVTHRGMHHPHSDTMKDPHSPIHGFWHSWLFWLWKIEESDINIRTVTDLIRDPVIAFFHKYYIQIYWAMNLVLAMIDVDFWLWFSIIPSVIAFHSYSITNSLNHYRHLGYRNYDTKDNSTNIWWLWPLVLGECWHNNHHGDVKDYHFGRRRWWEIDPAGAVIRIIKK
jgi:fatty-acid desaturase